MAVEAGSGPPAVPEPPAGAEPQAAHGPARRTVLVAGAGAVLVGAGAGVAAEFLTQHSRTPQTSRADAATVLRAAVQSERDLLADVRATAAAQPSLRPLLAQLRRDHEKHERVLTAMVRAAGAEPTRPIGPRTGGRSTTATPGPARSGAELATAARSAATLAAARARRLGARDATILASIAACEAVHAVLLS